jgi:cell fate (sporulation/competence/biofilm development) regulator YlbF (YheA/YmcA/DUF963 family)
METMTDTFPISLVEAVDDLAVALNAAPPLTAYRTAETALTGDAEASALLEQFAALQRALRVQQMDGTLTQADLTAARALEQQLTANVTIMDYVTAQQAALAALPEVNQMISELLGFDFAQLARRSAC